MLKKEGFKLVAIIVLLLGFHFGQAQNSISSPYSKYGFGLPSNVTCGAYDAMGKVGYAMQNPYLINFKNPASYAAFDSLSFIADAAFSIYSSTLRTSEISQKATYARPGYFTLGLPVTKHWRTSAGILPFSNLGYSIIDSKSMDNVTSVTYSYDADGGLLQLYWGNAFKICKGLSIGLNASYMFGTLSYSQSAIYDGSYFFNTRVSRTILVDGIYLSGGIQYFTTIKNKHRLGFGLVYENTAYLWTKQTDFIYNYSVSGTSEVLNDSVSYNNGKSNMRIPQTIGGGISYQYKDKLWITADVAWKNYSKFAVGGETCNEMRDAITTSAGLQFVTNATSSNYLKKIRLRVGARYTTGQIVLNNHPIQDFSVSFGLGFPLKLYSNNSSLGVMFEYGQMGTIKYNLVKENYFRISLHFTLQEKWYQRVKLE